MNSGDLQRNDLDDVVRQLTDREDDDDGEYHPSGLGQSAHALHAGSVHVPVQFPHAVDDEHVEDGDSDQRNEQAEHQERVGPRLTIAHARPLQLTRLLHH